MKERPDLNDGKDWFEMDLEELATVRIVRSEPK